MTHRKGHAVAVPDDPAYLSLVADLLDHPVVQQMALHGADLCCQSAVGK